jgi:hypothetical protein
MRDEGDEWHATRKGVGDPRGDAMRAYACDAAFSCPYACMSDHRDGLDHA